MRHIWLCVYLVGLSSCAPAWAGTPKQVLTGTASYYTVQSAINEGTCTDAPHRRCLMANGRPLNDQAYTAAIWHLPFGTTLRVCQEAIPQRCVDVRVTDRGPSLRLYRQGRLLDLSKQAYQALAPLKTGVFKGTVEPL